MCALISRADCAGSAVELQTVPPFCEARESVPNAGEASDFCDTFLFLFCTPAPFNFFAAFFESNLDRDDGASFRGLAPSLSYQAGTERVSRRSLCVRTKIAFARYN